MKPAAPLPTVLLHGFLGQPADWAPVQAALGPALHIRVLRGGLELGGEGARCVARGIRRFPGGGPSPSRGEAGGEGPRRRGVVRR